MVDRDTGREFIFCESLVQCVDETHKKSLVTWDINLYLHYYNLMLYAFLIVLLMKWHKVQVIN